MRYLIKNKLIGVFFILLMANINAQIVPSQHITTLDGLPNNQVESILKDSRGILWVGTNNGLSKIENNVITNFFKEDGLVHNSVWSIIEDANNNLWIGSYGGGVTKFDGKSFTVFDKKKGLVNNNIRKLFNYKNYVFVGTENGLSVINTKNDSISTFDTSSILNYYGETDFQVMDFFEHNNEVYCGTYISGIFKIDIENKQIDKIQTFNPNRKALFSVNLQNDIFYYGIDGGSAGNTKGAILKFNIDSLLNNKKESLVFGKSIIWEYAIDKNRNLYGAAWGVHTNDGGVYQIKDDVFINRTVDFGVKSNDIRAIQIDKKNNFLYVGSLDDGLYKVDLNYNVNFFNIPKLDIVDIDSYNRNIFFLHKKGVSIVEENKIIKETSSSKLFAYAKNFMKTSSKTPVFGWKKRTSGLDIVYHKIIYKDNSLWISTNIGLYQLSMDGNILNYFPVLVANFGFDFNNGFIDPIPYRETVIYTSLKDQIKKEYSLKDINTPRDISSIIKAKNKIYFASSFRGLFVLQNGKFKSLKNAKLFEKEELNHLAITDDLKTLVISSISGDVFLANIENEFKLDKIINKNLIIGNSILFLETYKNAVLIGTEKGLNVFNDGKFQFIDGEQGFKSENYTSSKVVGDNLIVGTNEGYYELNLARILYGKQLDLKLNISDLYVNHLKYDKNEFNWFNYNKNELELNYNENTVLIDFKVSSHPYPNKLLYSYQVKGLDTTWTKYSNKTNILLPYLPSGKFNINVKVKDLNSGEISISNLLSLVVTPPFWKTWWFFLSIFSIAVLIGLFVYKKRIKYITHREEQKSIIQQRIIETKLEALQSQMNPHFTFNAMNSIQNYIIDNDIDNALMYLGEFAKLIRKTLDNSSQPFITLGEEISYLQSYIALENMRHNNRVEVEMNYDKIDLQEIDIPPMLIQPFVENVFVHAFKNQHSKPKITIEFTIENEFLVCRIADNGSGMSETLSGQMHKSKGMKLVSERLNLLNDSSENSFKIDSKTGIGTTIILQLKIPNYND